MSVIDDMQNAMVGKKWYVTGGDSGQCTAVPHELQERLKLGIVYGNAKDTYDNAPDSVYIKALNTPAYIPPEGAIGVSKSGSWGHTWVVRRGSTTSVENRLEQNNPLNSPVRAVSNNYTGVYGYFTPRALSAVPAQPTTTPTDTPKAANEGVVNGQGLHGHTEPNMTSPWPWFFDDNEHVTILSRTKGPTPNVGPYKPSDWWYLVQGVGSPKVWVSDEFIRTQSNPANVPDFTNDTTTPDPTPVSEYSPRPAQGLFGVDVSSIGQGTIDWNLLVKGDGTRATEGAGVDFVVARAGHVGSSHGGGANNADPQFDFNRSEALRLGVPFGAYWFCYPSLDPKAEAAAFAVVVSKVEDSESLWADIETAPEAGDHDLIEWCKTFKSEVERYTGHKLRGYYNSDFNSRFPGLKDVFGSDGVWAAKFDNIPGRPFPEAIMHQYTSSGKLPGITGSVDLNVFWGTKEEFINLGRKLGGVQTPPPTGTPGVDSGLSDKIDAQTNILNKILVIVQAILDTLTKVFK